MVQAWAPPCLSFLILETGCEKRWNNRCESACMPWRDTQMLVIAVNKAANLKVCIEKELKLTSDPKFPPKEPLEKLQGASSFSNLLVLLCRMFCEDTPSGPWWPCSEGDAFIRSGDQWPEWAAPWIFFADGECSQWTRQKLYRAHGGYWWQLTPRLGQVTHMFCGQLCSWRQVGFTLQTWLGQATLESSAFCAQQILGWGQKSWQLPLRYLQWRQPQSRVPLDTISHGPWLWHGSSPSPPPCRGGPSRPCGGWWLLFPFGLLSSFSTNFWFSVFLWSFRRKNKKRGLIISFFFKVFCYI